MNLPVSIITISYNAEKTIGSTLQSLREQTFRNFEHIVVDGASSDRTLDVVRALGRDDARILSERDNGLYEAMNKGLNLAKGEFVLFLNSGDTFASSDTLQYYVDAINGDIDIIYGDTQLVDANGNILGPRHLSVPDVLTLSSFKKGMLICHQAFMVRRSIAPKYNERYRFSADYDWCVRCISATTPERCVNLKRVTVDYLVDGLTDKNKLKSLMERYEIMRHHYGLREATWANISFIPRMIKRRIGRK